MILDVPFTKTNPQFPLPPASPFTSQCYDYHATNINNRVWMSCGTCSFVPCHAQRVVRRVGSRNQDLFPRKKSVGGGGERWWRVATTPPADAHHCTSYIHTMYCTCIQHDHAYTQNLDESLS